jgi:hypothetical protein
LQPVGGAKVEDSRRNVFVLSELRTTSVTFLARLPLTALEATMYVST